MDFITNLSIFIGDIAYDMNGDNGRIGDYYLRRIESFAAKIPYMVVPGNREYECSKYCPRFLVFT